MSWPQYTGSISVCQVVFVIPKKVMERPNFDTNAWDTVIVAEKNLDAIILGDGAAETSPADIDELKIYNYARSAEQLAVEVRP